MLARSHLSHDKHSTPKRVRTPRGIFAFWIGSHWTPPPPAIIFAEKRLSLPPLIFGPNQFVSDRSIRKRGCSWGLDFAMFARSTKLRVSKAIEPSWPPYNQLSKQNCRCCVRVILWLKKLTSNAVVRALQSPRKQMRRGGGVVRMLRSKGQQMLESVPSTDEKERCEWRRHAGVRDCGSVDNYIFDIDICIVHLKLNLP